MVGKVFITRHGYDPQMGKHVKDPYLGPCPTMGACRPDIRRSLKKGDHIFVISGKVRGFNQFVMGGFEIASKMPAIEAYNRFPELRLRQLEDGQLTGNIIVDSDGHQHPLDNHNAFDERIKNYIVGTNPVALTTPGEIEAGRLQTMEVLQEILGRRGSSPFELFGRAAPKLTERQVLRMREWLESLKVSDRSYV